MAQLTENKAIFFIR